MNKQLQKGHVYIVENNDGFIKIGKSIEPIKRIKTIQSSSGREITNSYFSNCILNYSKLEKQMHEHLKNHRTCGEWFIFDFNSACLIMSDLEKELLLIGDNKENSSIDIKKAMCALMPAIVSNPKCSDYMVRGLCDARYCEFYSDRCITDGDFDLVFEKHGSNFNYECTSSLADEIKKIKKELVNGTNNEH